MLFGRDMRGLVLAIPCGVQIPNASDAIAGSRTADPGGVTADFGTLEGEMLNGLLSRLEAILLRLPPAPPAPSPVGADDTRPSARRRNRS